MNDTEPAGFKREGEAKMNKNKEKEKKTNVDLVAESPDGVPIGAGFFADLPPKELQLLEELICSSFQRRLVLI